MFLMQMIAAAPFMWNNERLDHEYVLPIAVSSLDPNSQYCHCSIRHIHLIETASHESAVFGGPDETSQSTGLFFSTLRSPLTPGSAGPGAQTRLWHPQMSGQKSNPNKLTRIGLIVAGVLKMSRSIKPRSKATNHHLEIVETLNV